MLTTFRDSPRWLPWAVGVLLTWFAFTAWRGAMHQGVTADEIAHLTAGYSYWTTDSYRLQPENGYIPQRWAAFPLLAMDLKFPSIDPPAWPTSDVWRLGFQFFYVEGNPLERMLAAARAFQVIFGVACGALVFLWAKRLGGPTAGLVALVLFAFCPTFLAHAPLVTSDAAAALGFLIALAALDALCRRISLLRILAAGVAIAFLSLAKHSAPLIAPVALALIAWHTWRERVTITTAWRPFLRRVTAHVGAVAFAIALVWTAYGFHFALFPPEEKNPRPLHTWERVTSTPGLVTNTVAWARSHRLLPEPWLYGFAHVYHFSRQRPAFFRGENRTTGWRAFFPYAFAVKTPLAWLGLGTLLLVGTVVCRLPARTTALAPPADSSTPAPGIAPLAIFVVIYGTSAITTPLNIGHRHLLPLYPALYVLAGVAFTRILACQRWLAVICTALLVTGAIEAQLAAPHYLTFFNAIEGGRATAYRRLVDSSLDWGQGLPALRDWLEEHRRPGEPLYLSYFGSDDPARFGFPATRVGDTPFDMRSRRIPADFRGGLYAISATIYAHVYSYARGPWDDAKEKRLTELRAAAMTSDRLAGTENRRELLDHLEHHEFARLCAWLKRYRTPDTLVAGGSILIFRLSDEDVAAGRHAPWPFSP